MLINQLKSMNHTYAYHVSNNSGGESGVFSADTMDEKYPMVLHMMTEKDLNHIQFSDDDGQTIVTREPADKFVESSIQ